MKKMGNGDLMKQTKGMIIKGSGGLYDILCEGGELISCRAKGVFRHEAISPTVGDRVSLSFDSLDNPVIEKIEQRKNLLIRPSLANLDKLFILIPSSRPSPDYFTVDKLSAIAAHNSIEVIMVISKCLLDTEKASQAEQIYKKSAHRVFVTDSREDVGCKEILDYLSIHCQGQICAFAGASGVGKSTLLNRLFPELSLSTGEVSQKTGRGRHTTRTVELFKTDKGFFIADTPGFTMLDFEHFDFFALEDLVDAFIEFAPYVGKCRYTKCTHIKEEGCAIVEAVAAGELSQSRHASYIALRDILKNKQPWKKK